MPGRQHLDVHHHGAARTVELDQASPAGVVGERVLLVDQRLPDLVGAALLRQGSPAEAIVRATLDAVNRQLLRWG